MRWILKILVPLLFLAGTDAISADPDRKTTLSLGVTGSAPADPSRNPAAILGSADSQALVLAIAERPHSRAEIEAAISGQDFTVDDMVAGEPAVRVDFTFDSHGIPFVGRRIYVVHNNRMFEIGLQGRETTLPLFQAVLDSITFPAGPCEH